MTVKKVSGTIGDVRTDDLDLIDYMIDKALTPLDHFKGYFLCFFLLSQKSNWAEPMDPNPLGVKFGFA